MAKLPYFNYHRVLDGDIIVHGYSIITTDIVRFDVYEKIQIGADTHASYTRFTFRKPDEYFGLYTSRRSKTTDLAMYPGGHYDKVMAHQLALSLTSQEFIERAFPELQHVKQNVWDGSIWVTRTDLMIANVLEGGFFDV